MLKLIIGTKGTGKTKALIELVNEALARSKGSVVCIEKGDKLRFDINYRCRLIDSEQYKINEAKTLYGFIAGMIASNHDITDLFVDSALKICQNNTAEFDSILSMIDRLSTEYSVNTVMTSSIDVAEASETVKKYI